MKNKPEFLSVRVSKSLKRKLLRLAKDQDRSLSWVVASILKSAGRRT